LYRRLGGLEVGNILKNKGEIVEKVFYPKDVFFNNGIVNLYDYLQKANIDSLEYNFSNKSLKLEFNKHNEIQIFDYIVHDFIKNNKLVVFTDNDRLFWSKERNVFIKDKRVDIPSGAKNEKKYILYKEKLSKIGLTLDELKTKYNDCLDNQLNKFGQLVDKNGNVIIHKGFKDYVDQYKNVVLWKEQKDQIGLDSKIHTFEWGSGPFMDMLPNECEKINKWEALIYWFGTRIKRFYNLNFFLYMNSSELKSLFYFKKEINISDKKTSVKDQKTEEIRTIPTNIDFRNQLSKDRITNPNFYISNSQEEFQLKFFMYLFSLIYHIEDRYIGETDEKRKIRIENLFNSLQDITFFTYTQDDAMKSSLNEYSKAYRLIKFFRKIKEHRIALENKNIFTYLSELITAIGLSKSNKEINLNIKSFSNNLLDFKSLRKNYLEASFDVLEKEKRGLGKELFIFEKMYLAEIKEEVNNMDLHEKSKIIGEGIGFFEAQIDDRNLLFALRNIKNFKQLISYFKDFKFEVLKNQEKARFNADFNASLADVLKDLFINPGNWEIIRDYIAIYAVDRYKSVSYAKDQNKGGK